MGVPQKSTMLTSRDDTVLGPHPKCSLEDHSLQGTPPHIKGQWEMTKQSCVNGRLQGRRLRTLHRSRGRKADLNACWKGHVARGHEGVVQWGEGSSGIRHWLRSASACCRQSGICIILSLILVSWLTLCLHFLLDIFSSRLLGSQGAMKCLCSTPPGGAWSTVFKTWMFSKTFY